MSAEGYLAIMQKILVANQAYLEAELERAVLNFLYPRNQEKNELYTTYLAHFELLGRELDQQLSPGPPLDERIKAIILMKHCHLTQEQRLHLALRRAGMQPCRAVADMLRTLDRPEAFLQQSTASGAVRRSYPMALESPESWEERDVSVDAGMVRAMVQEAVQEYLPRQEEEDEREEENDEEDENGSMSHDDYDEEGYLLVEFDQDCDEYSESEAVHILANQIGRAQVRRELSNNPH